MRYCIKMMLLLMVFLISIAASSAQSVPVPVPQKNIILSAIKGTVSKPDTIVQLENCISVIQQERLLKK